ncbi:MAG: UDP-N-acetylmuramoyl-tripeptide--D-alanyl-D-alanine ligase [Fimbriimonadaceae bacterium]|nr:UDP-N-acetylmuramoyl-tripeptide--D-alanyl-D-alanine ligase [Fimbriimonadaceae bacterium]
MRRWTLAEFAERAGGIVRDAPPDATFDGFTTDSRETQSGKLFMAIRGGNADGHAYAPTVLGAGATAVLAERPVSGARIEVENLVDALARFARSVRSEFGGPVIGITGSAGKTTTKEFTATAVGSAGPVLKNPGNRNSEYTSPILWAELEGAHRSVVVEMGMRGFGQIAHLAGLHRPTIGVVTNIGYAHIEKVGSREGIAEAKLELLRSLDPQSGISVVWQEDEYLQRLVYGSPSRVLTFGMGDDADGRLLRYQPLESGGSVIEGTLNGERFEATLPTIGRHNALNATAALLVATATGAPLSAAADGLKDAQIPPMRTQTLGYRGATLLLDAYNASPPSVVYALETLFELPAQRRFAVLGEMRELGEATEEGHRMVGRAVAAMRPDGLVLIGESTRFLADEAIGRGYPSSRLHPMETIADVQDFLATLGEGDAALVKGSRALELERAVPAEARAR